MPDYNLYRYGADGKLEGTIRTHSDTEIDVSLYMPPIMHTFTEPPAYESASQIPVWNGVAWIVRELAEYLPTLEQVKAAKLAEIAQDRWIQETGGVEINGVRVATDDRSQGLIAGAAMKAMQDAAYTCWWKGEAGWALLNAQTILAIADAVRAHVQACFDKERLLDTDIEAAETIEAVQAINW